jgi:hypothetical protein
LFEPSAQKWRAEGSNAYTKVRTHFQKGDHTPCDLKGLLVSRACINDLIAVQRRSLCGSFLHRQDLQPSLLVLKAAPRSRQAASSGDPFEGRASSGQFPSLEENERRRQAHFSIDHRFLFEP